MDELRGGTPRWGCDSEQAEGDGSPHSHDATP